MQTSNDAGWLNYLIDQETLVDLDDFLTKTAFIYRKKQYISLVDLIFPVRVTAEPLLAYTH